MILEFPGSMHYGFNVPVSTLKRLTRLQMIFGIEIFPDQEIDESSWVGPPPTRWQERQDRE